MSPEAKRSPVLSSSFPRVSGDEPAIADPLGKSTAFSPRERG